MIYIFVIVLFVLLLSTIGNLQSQEKRISRLERNRKHDENRELQKKCVQGLVCPNCENELVRKGNYYDWDVWTDSLKESYSKDARFCCVCTYTGLEEEFLTNS